MKKLSVTYYSQRIDVLDSEWKSRSCGICSLKMTMDFLRSKNLSLDELIREGLAIGAYLKGVGWLHQGLVNLAKKHGFKNAFRKEWAEDEKEKGIKFIVENLEKNIPVLASIKNKDGGHLVLIVGEEKAGFYIHDPDAYERKDGEFKFLDLPEFLKIWKGRIIVLGV